MPTQGSAARCPACAAELLPSAETLGSFPLQRCGGCGLRFAPSAVGVPIDYTAIYDTREYQETLVADFRAGDADAFARIPTYRPFFEHLQARGRSLLDVGCGVGRFCRAAASHGWAVSGIDVSARAIEIGAPTAPFPMRVAKVEELVSAGERYDVVTSFEVVEHLADPLAFLQNLRALLRERGEVFLTVPHWEHPEVQSSTRADWVPPVHLTFFTAAALAALVERAGLRVIAAGQIRMGSPWGGRGGWLGRIGRRALGRPAPGLGLWIHAGA